jgi:hypothetical protein
MTVLREPPSLQGLRDPLLAAPSEPDVMHRAFIRQPSGRFLDLLAPSPEGWTDEDLATGLSRTYRWGGHSIWPLPYSVAQHSLAVVELYRERAAKLRDAAPTEHDLLRELLHDADEALIGGFDPISPLKPMLGAGYADIVAKLQAAVSVRYGLRDRTQYEARLHRHADLLAAASEAVHVAGWSPSEVLDLLNIGLAPAHQDPLAALYGCTPWEPWPPTVAADRFLDQLRLLRRRCGQASS